MADVTRQSTIDRVLQPTRALLAISILLPAVLLALAAWQSYRDVLRDAAVRVEHNSRILHEHAVKVFETHKLVIDQVNDRLQELDLKKPADAKALYDLLRHIQGEFAQVATITVTDAQGRMIASGRTFPADPSITFTDRDWFQALKARDYKRPYISRSSIGTQSGESVFNIAERITGPDPKAFYGVIAVSVNRKYFENFYRDVEPGFIEYVVLFRNDGSILAQEPAQSAAILSAKRIAKQLDATPGGYLSTHFNIGGEDQIAGFRKVADYPVIVGFAISKNSALAQWRTDLLVYAGLALLASLCLSAVSAMAMRQAARQREATERWRAAANSLSAEAEKREKVESQLRQAQKMEAVGRLTGGIAHDFNNLLTVVLGSLELLGRRLGTAGEHRSYIDNAMEAARRAAALTGRLLAFSRQQPLAPAVVDVNKLVSGMSDLLKRILGEQVEIHVALADGLWPVHADPNQLESAIVNLAVNARDAMPKGGKLTIETGNSHLDNVYALGHHDVRAGQYVVVCVSDTGTGMPPDVVANAFEPFFTTKPVGEGTGLGLSQVYGFAKQSGGHAAIYSELGEGTAIRLYLPRYMLPRHVGTAAEQSAAALVEAVAQEPAGGRLILVVEDDAAVREFTASVLRESGYQVVDAANAEQALRLLSQHDDIALLFTDIVLTGSMNGRNLADKVKGLRPDLPVLFTTGYTRNAIIHHGRLDEGIAFIGKPFTVQALSAKVAEVLKGRP